MSAELVTLDGDLDAESLEVDDDGKDNDGREQAHNIRQPLPPESLAQRTAFIVPREQEVEHGDNGTLELGPTADVDGGGGEGLPDDRLADVGGNKQIDAGSKTVALLEELVEEDDDEGSNDEPGEEKANTGTKVPWLAIEAG